ncbi:phage head morphogenesis protein [Clostridium botulinum]|nr:minor capsid protein [Clostridium botulinum]NFH74429.1 phage head morphogenesis protein [Clostridium botulinum]NFJ73834.1 phage head morphogenesis protein [Clostridium botulinum]NFN61282.1 phage head morphogenesis protein [Clostridium botulinum]
MSKKLTKEQQLYIDKQLEFAEELYNKADEQLKEVYKAQLSNRNEILTEIANTMLSYNIADSKLSISIAEKKKLKEKLSKVIKDKMQDELINETNLTNEILKYIGKEKYNTNNYLHDIGMNVSWDIKPVDDTNLKNVINAKVDNKLWSDRLWDNKNDLQKDLQLEITDFLNGKTSVNEIEAKIKKKYNSNVYNTKRLINTEICRVQGSINDVWVENHDIKYQMFMATLDGKTSELCRNFDGKTFNINDINKPVPPLHPFCRSALINLPNKDWRPKMRMDNSTKQNINWQSFEEWKVNHDI